MANPEEEHEGSGQGEHSFGDEVIRAAQEAGLDRQRPGSLDMSEFEDRMGGQNHEQVDSLNSQLDRQEQQQREESAREQLDRAVQDPESVAAFRADAQQIFEMRFPNQRLAEMNESAQQSARERRRLEAVTTARDNFARGDRLGGWNALEGRLARTQGDGTPQTMWTDEIRNVSVSLLDAEKEAGLVDVSEQDESFEASADFLRERGSDRVKLLLDDIQVDHPDDSSTKVRRLEELLTRVEASMATAASKGASPESRLKLRLAQHAIYLERGVTEETVAGQMRRDFDDNGPDQGPQNYRRR